MLFRSQIVVHSSRDVKFHYMVNGVRQAFKDYQPIKDSFGIFAPLSPDRGMPSTFSPEQRRRLIANGTFNADGTVNMETAERVGWAQKWREAEAAAKAQAAARAAKTDRN